jgi:hypothetical protein
MAQLPPVAVIGERWSSGHELGRSHSVPIGRRGHWGGGHSGDGHNHSHGAGCCVIGIGVGLGWGYGWGWGWGGPYYYPPYYYPPSYYPPYSYGYSVGVAPPVYVQRQDLEPAAPPPSYWYYCRNPEVIILPSRNVQRVDQVAPSHPTNRFPIPTKMRIARSSGCVHSAHAKHYTGPPVYSTAWFGEGR